MGFFASGLFFGALVFAFGARDQTRKLVAVIIAVAIVLSLIGK